MASNEKGSPYTRLSKFLPSTRQIVQFSEGGKEPNETDVIGYIDGTFDLFRLHLLFKTHSPFHSLFTFQTLAILKF